MAERDHADGQDRANRDGGILTVASGRWSESQFVQLLVEPVRNGVYKKKEFHGRGVKIVNMGELFANPRLRDMQMRRVELSESEQHRFSVQTGDLLFARRSLVAEGAGKCCVVLEINEPTAFESSIIRARPDPTTADSLFLYYYFNSPIGLHSLDTIRRQVAVAGITGTDLAQLPLRVPSLPEQRAIAQVLGTLDDKIELNRRMNQTLEEMARALFKSWFVDFEPVRAKMEGRWRRGESLPGLPAEHYNLFPDRLVDSELGEIPEGWEVRGLGEILQQRIERCHPSVETKAIPYVPIDCITPRNLFLTSSKSGEEALSSLTRFRKGDLLFGAMRPYFHKVCIAPFDGTTRTTAFVLYPKFDHDLSFGTFLLHSPDTIDFATRTSTGSTIPYAVWAGSLELMPAVVPSAGIRKAFHAVVRPILRRIPETYFEISSLTALRDALLPRLLSGEVEVGVH